MTEVWDDQTPGLCPLPTGRRIRGRGLRDPMPDGPPPTLGVYLTGRRPPRYGWETHWIRWPDFWLPTDSAAATATLRETWKRAAHERVEIACSGGKGRTGTALAVLAVLDGVPAAEAVAYVRAHYSPHAVETPWQRRYVRRTHALGKPRHP
ncbi:protein-tyrosine phosphatase family protein [Mangrovihabitans endophyticus]|uniref:Protein-tyrosine-phosphatase n=1 Tax=Mangrovihabitans endophyticus TaxID=1751298 RepID=A0A8J3C4L3_9ACTN|nr:protein-tyrosine phosphatase family protein [Mangrovihabitans endophyticus]GGL09635.1 protein-tyrosine-phosphatase [Mangrovihabitans endophyticus]